MKRLAILVLAFASICHAQGGGIGSNFSTVINNTGRPVAGAGVAVCQPLATTAASVTSNIAVLTMASNPVTAGFAQGMTLMVSGFTGGDTYFNGGTYNGSQITGGFTILSVTSTTIAYQLVHANASAGTNGTALQEGNISTGCGGLATVYTDPTDSVATANPFTTDGLGNWEVFGPSGTYYVQFYGASVTTTLRQVVVGSITGAVTASAANQVIVSTGVNTAAGQANVTYVPGTQLFTITGTNAPNVLTLAGTSSSSSSSFLLNSSMTSTATGPTVANGQFSTSWGGNGVGGGSVVEGVLLQTTATPTGVLTDLYGVRGVNTVSGSASSVANSISLYGQYNGTGITTNAYGVQGAVDGSAGTVTNGIGLYGSSIGAANNWALKTGAGIVEFAGQVTADSGITGVTATLACAYQGPASPVTGTSAAATYYTCTIPAGAIAAGAGIRFTIWAKHTTGTASITYTMSFGGTSTTGVGPSGSANQIEKIIYEVHNAAASSSSQTIGSVGQDSNVGTNSIHLDTSAINTASSVVVNFQFNVANTDAITPEMMITEMLAP